MTRAACSLYRYNLAALSAQFGWQLPVCAILNSSVTSTTTEAEASAEADGNDVIKPTRESSALGRTHAAHELCLQLLADQLLGALRQQGGWEQERVQAQQRHHG